MNNEPAENLPAARTEDDVLTCSPVGDQAVSFPSGRRIRLECRYYQTRAQFGIGFLSALFSCESISVESKDGCLSTLAAYVLSFKRVTINPVIDWNGITTKGFKPEAHQIESHLNCLATLENTAHRRIHRFQS